MFFKELQMDDLIEMVLALFKNDNNGENIEWYIEDHKLFINSEVNEVLLRFNDCINEDHCINIDGRIHKTIDIAIVQFLHKRQGYCTKLIGLLYKYGKKHGYSSVVLEGVMTKEMSSFAKKSGFTQIDRMNWEMKLTV